MGGFRRLALACRSCVGACISLAAGVCVCNSFTCLVGYPASVSGCSMQPTLNPPDALKADASCDVMHKMRQTLPTFVTDDWVWINCMAARKITREGAAHLNRGLVIVFVSPKDPSEFVIKRVIAKENDVIRNAGRTLVIPKGHCWVEGDNASKSIDSRRYGPISVGLITGVASHIISPFRRIRALDSSAGVKNKSTVILHENHDLSYALDS